MRSSDFSILAPAALALAACEGGPLASAPGPDTFVDDGGRTVVITDGGVLVPQSDADPAPMIPIGGSGGGSGAACALTIDQIAIYQGVKIPLVLDGQEVPSFNADVVQRRPARVRAFVKLAGPGGAAKARLTITSATGSQTFDDERTISRDTVDPVPNTGFNFDLPANALTANARYSVDIVEPAACAGKARFPATGDAALRPRQTGTLKVTLVPIRYQADGSGRLPDTSDEQLAKYRELLWSLFPVEAVELTVRAPVNSNVRLASFSSWDNLLEAVRALRAQDGPPANVYYYGLVSPATTFNEYCQGDCIAGISYQPDAGSAFLRAGVGIGFGDGIRAADAMAHELGHQHGRGHAPCGTDQGVDSDFPYEGGGVGAWGYDVTNGSFYSPDGRRDLMSYCAPRWISDWTYARLVSRSALINPPATALAVAEPTRTWRTVLLDAEGRTRWSLPATLAGTPPGRRVDARVVDPVTGTTRAIAAYRTEIPHTGSAVLFVPDGSGRLRVEIPGAASLAYDAPLALSPFGR